MIKLFSNSKYTRWYWTIIEYRRAHPLPKNLYAERHHIIPDCFYITRSRPGIPGWLPGDPDDITNLVWLTGREHALCHWLLVKMTRDDTRAYELMVYAFDMMSVYGGHQHRGVSRMITRAYERNKIEVARLRSERMKIDNPMDDAESRKKVGDSKRGKKRKPFNQEWLDNLCKANSGEGNGMYGKKHREETLKVLREKASARRYSEETNEKRREASSGRKEITDGTVYKKVKGDELQYWLDQGWIVKGKPRKKSVTK